MTAISKNTVRVNFIPVLFTVIVFVSLLAIYSHITAIHPPVTLPQTTDQYTRSLCDEYIKLIEAMQHGEVDNIALAEGERGVLHEQIANALGIDHAELTTEMIRELWLNGKLDGQDAGDED